MSSADPKDRTYKTWPHCKANGRSSLSRQTVQVTDEHSEASIAVCEATSCNGRASEVSLRGPKRAEREGAADLVSACQVLLQSGDSLRFSIGACLSVYDGGSSFSFNGAPLLGRHAFQGRHLFGLVDLRRGFFGGLDSFFRARCVLVTVFARSRARIGCCCGRSRRVRGTLSEVGSLSVFGGRCDLLDVVLRLLAPFTEFRTVFRDFCGRFSPADCVCGESVGVRAFPARASRSRGRRRCCRWCRLARLVRSARPCCTVSARHSSTRTSRRCETRAVARGKLGRDIMLP